MEKTSQFCACGQPLIFRGWSNRYSKSSKWKEALADCLCGQKWQIRYFNGRPTSDPYQVRSRARKTKQCSAKLTQERYDEIISVYGSFQKFVDLSLVGNTEQYKI